jgi:hypothetical protein
MTDEIKMLRRALEEMQNAMSNLWNYAPRLPERYKEQGIDANEHAAFALRVTSDALPPGYSITHDIASGRYFPRIMDYLFPGKDDWTSFASDFEARLFCWEKHESAGKV